MMGSTLENKVAVAIESTAPEVETTDFGWRIRLGLHPHATEVDVRIEDDGWLLLDMLLVTVPYSHFQTAEINGRLRGGVKLAFAPEEMGMHARAELPLLVDGDLAERLHEAACGFEQASALVYDRDTRERYLAGTDADSNAPAPVAAAADAELEALSEECEWEFTRRSGGRLAVELEGAVGFHQAQLERRADGDVALSVAIDISHPSNRMTEETVANFLLRLSAALRMARAVGGSPDGGVVPRFEVVFSSSPNSSELSEAASALSVAVRFGARELQLLASSERVVRSYLVRNPLSVRCGARKQVPTNTKSAAPKGKRRAAAATGKSASTRGERGERSPRNRKNRSTKKEN